MKVSSRNMTRVIAAFDALHAGCACGLTADGIERCKMHRAILRYMDGNPEACIFSCVKLCEKPVGNSSRSLTHCRIGCLCIISLFTSRSGYYIFARLSFCFFFTFKFEIMHAGLQFIILSVAEGYGGKRCINAASCAEDCREVLCLSSVSSHIYGSSSCSGTGTLMIDLNALPLSVYCSRRSSLFFCTCLHKLM